MIKAVKDIQNHYLLKPAIIASFVVYKLTIFDGMIDVINDDVNTQI